MKYLHISYTLMITVALILLVFYTQGDVSCYFVMGSSLGGTGECRGRTTGIRKV